MTSVPGWAAHADRSLLRSSVASKRFPLSNEQLARFRFARVVSCDADGWDRKSRMNFAEPMPVSRELKDEGQDADDQPADRKSARRAEVAQEGAGAAAVAAEARRLHARLHHDPEEAELGASQGRKGTPDQWLRGDRLHSR